MTELAHGSNVAGLETTATFDEKTDEFVIHTPHVGATKWWIGGGLGPVPLDPYPYGIANPTLDLQVPRPPRPTAPCSLSLSLKARNMA